MAKGDGAVDGGAEGSAGRRVTRRRFVQAGALAAAGLAASGPRAAARVPAQAAGEGVDYDAIVIGAGFAGVTAARELRKRSFRVLLLEAHGRAGGRTFTADFAGHAVELGGAFFHWFQPHAWAEITRYDLQITEAETSDEPLFSYVTSGELRQGKADEVFAALYEGSARYFHDARAVLERPHDPLRAPGIAALDPQSARDRLDALELPALQRDLLDALLSVSCHCDPGQAGLVEMLRWHALSGFTLPNQIDATGRYTLVGGTRRLIEAILEDGAPEVRLGTPVRGLRQDGERVVVTTLAGDTLAARAAVVTVPLNALANIEFTPPLSAAKREIARAGHAGSGVKLHVRLKGRLAGRTGFAPWPSPLSYLGAEHVAADSTLLTGFGPSGKLLDVQDPAAVAAAVRALLPEAEVVDSIGYDWNADRWIRGTWCVYRPGQLTRYLRELQRPEGRVVYAGADNASGWRGFIDGAIESGYRAGREVTALLG